MGMKTGAAASISRGGHKFEVKAGSASTAEPFYFGFAGGFAGGGASATGTFGVVCSHDNADDPYEPLMANGVQVEVECVAGAKTVIPEAMFNAGWCKLVGSGTVLLSGVG